MCVQTFHFVPYQKLSDLTDLDLHYFKAVSGTKRVEELNLADINSFVQGLVESENEKVAALKSEWDDGWVL